MKITKRQLRRIIKEEKRRILAEQHSVEGSAPRDMFNPGQSPLEITKSGVTEAQVSEHWPNVLYKGLDVMDLMYDDIVVQRAEDALEDITAANFEGQESYLGWDPDADVFVMGFDVWEDPGMSAGIVVISPDGYVEDVNMGGRGMYPTGLAMIKKMFPRILDLRLD